MPNEIMPMPNVELVQATNVPSLLKKIRPAWRTKSLIERVGKLLDVDPSSACQRLLNAAIHDLRDKIVIAGLDIAAEAAKQNRLPPIPNEEDMENYPTAKLIDLAYHMGLLSRPEWRRVCRCYEIRRDLEHEDDEYEAGVEDCVYIFHTCVEVILAKDPTHLLKVKDVRELVEQAGSVIPDQSLLSDYERAPQPRQEEIVKFLISVSLDKNQLDIVQQNSFTFLSYLRPLTHNQVTLKIGTHLQEKIGRQGIDVRIARVAQAAGVFPYLRKTARNDFFEEFYKKMEKVGYYWGAYESHGELLRSFKECGSLDACPEEQQDNILQWLILVFIGQPGGVTRYGNVRNVYYSNSAAPLVLDIIGSSAVLIRDKIKSLASNDVKIKTAISNQHVARRYEQLVDLVEAK